MNHIARKILLMLASPLRGLGLRKFAVVRRVLGMLKPRTATVFGHTIFLDPEDFAVSQEISSGGYEKEEVGLIQKLIRSSDTVIDIGANIGYFTILFCSLANEVYAFEPAPKTFGFLKKNIESTGRKNARLYEMALGDREGAAQIFINQYNKGDNRLYPSFGTSGIDINITTLDRVLPSNTKVDLIKMDTQGYEVYALRGMQRVLRDNEGLRMIVECWPQGLKKAGSSAKEFFAELERFGFSWSVIHGSGLCAMSKDEFIAAYPADKDDYANLLCWKGERPVV